MPPDHFGAFGAHGLAVFGQRAASDTAIAMAATAVGPILLMLELWFNDGGENDDGENSKGEQDGKPPGRRELSPTL